MSRRRDDGSEDGGFGLVELLIGGTLLLIVMSIALTSVTQFAETGRGWTDHNLNEEARNSLNRMAREIRQADGLTYVESQWHLDPDAVKPEPAGRLQRRRVYRPERDLLRHR